MATMLDCKNIQTQLSEYVDGTLDGDTAWKINLHLASCAVCARAAEELGQTVRLLQNLPMLEPSANFEAMLASRLADKVLVPSRPRWNERVADTLRGWAAPRFRPAWASGAAFALLVPLALVVSRNTSVAPVTPQTTPTPVAVIRSHTPANEAAGETMDEIWRDHNAYASSEPLGEGAGLIAASGNTL